MQKQSFGEVLRDAREAQGVSMRGLAAAADMDPAYLSRLENGKTGEPRQETVEKLAQALCAEAGLAGDACAQLSRRLLEAAGHLQPKEELLDDLADRFAARLREQGWPEAHIDSTLAQVPLATMRAVLLGEEPLEIGLAHDYSQAELDARRAAGEQVLAFSIADLESAELQPDRDIAVVHHFRLDPASHSISDTAANYLERHAAAFASNRRMRRQQSRPQATRVFRAGTTARIEVESALSKDQEQQLRLIARLVASVLQEK